MLSSGAPKVKIPLLELEITKMFFQHIGPQPELLQPIWLSFTLLVWKTYTSRGLDNDVKKIFFAFPVFEYIFLFSSVLYIFYLYFSYFIII